MEPTISRAFEVSPPPGSQAESLVAGASFHDAWAAYAAEPSLPALGQFLKALEGTPRWVEACMALRNSLVRLVGLKHLGGLGRLDRQKPAAAYRPGDRVGIFTLLSASDDEAIFGIDDAHLDVRLSVHRRTEQAGAVLLTVTTAVKVHNVLGRLYMLPVKPMHRIIAPTVLNKVAQATLPA